MKLQEFKYHSIGFNHETCPLDIREALAISDQELEVALKSLNEISGVSEAVILSTCNRTEIYSFTENSDAILRWFSNFRNFDKGQINDFTYQKFGEIVARHVFRVAAGLDSMVLGETQILGQLKKSVRTADSLGTLGPNLRRLFDASFSAAKHIRSETDVGNNSVSLAAASLKIGERIFGSLKQLKVLFVGAGDMNRMCAEYFASYGVRELSIANRTLKRAEELSSAVEGNYFALSEVPKRLANYDIVISCTGSPLPIIGKRAIEKAIESRRHKPILLIDLAVPRDVELESSELEDVFLYTIDDLGEVVKSGISNRQEAAEDAEKIVDFRLAQFQTHLSRDKRVPVIKKFRQHGESIRDGELKRAYASLAKGDQPELVMKSLSRAIMNRFMHEPSRVINENPPDHTMNMSEALEKLFGLDED